MSCYSCSEKEVKHLIVNSIKQVRAYITPFNKIKKRGGHPSISGVMVTDLITKPARSSQGHLKPLVLATRYLTLLEQLAWKRNQELLYGTVLEMIKDFESKKKRRIS